MLDRAGYMKHRRRFQGIKRVRMMAYLKEMRRLRDTYNSEALDVGKYLVSNFKVHHAGEQIQPGVRLVRAEGDAHDKG